MLIAETDEVFRKHIAEHLRAESYIVLEASEESEVRSILQRKGIDVALLGIRGAKQEGLSLLRKIKTIRPLTEVILMTPLEEHSLYASIEAMKLGAFDDLLMPFDLETLLERIRAACKRKRDREKLRKAAPGATREEGDITVKGDSKEVGEKLQLHKQVKPVPS